MFQKDFSLRLSELRSQKDISAREMSRELGQNPGYINNIENGKALPSMHIFFYICEFLGVSPSEFFDLETKNPEKVDAIAENLKKLSPETLDHVDAIVSTLANKKGS